MTPSSLNARGVSVGGLGRGGQGMSTEALNKSNRPRYDAVCVGLDKCVAVTTCDELPSALAALNIDDDELVEIVTEAVCGG